MALIYEGNTRNLYKRNREYIEIAKRNGFFEDRAINSDLTTSTDSVVIYWIDELGDTKKDLTKYKNEILPNFKKWWRNGVSTLGVGTNYEFIKALENGIEINRDSIGCLLAIIRKYQLAGEQLDEDTINNIINNMLLYKINGIPIDYKLAERFEIVGKEEKISGSSSK